MTNDSVSGPGKGPEKERMTNDSVLGIPVPEKDREKTLKEISIESNLINIKFFFWDSREQRYSKHKTTTVAKCADFWHVSFKKAWTMLEEMEKKGFIVKEIIKGGGVHLTDQGVEFLENYEKEKQDEYNEDELKQKIRKFIEEFEIGKNKDEKNKDNEKKEEKKTYKDKLLELVPYYPQKKSLFLDYEEINTFDEQISDELIEHPETTIKLFDDIINEQSTPSNYQGVIHYYTRFNLPTYKRTDLSDIGGENIGNLILINGIVTNVFEVFEKYQKATFQCPLCGTLKEVEMETKFLLVTPSVCDNCKKPVRFKIVPEESSFVNAQRIEVQEKMENLDNGQEGKKIIVWLEDDLVSDITVGMNVAVVGIIKLLPPKDPNSAFLKKYIYANNITIADNNKITFEKEDIKKFKEFSQQNPLQNVQSKIATDIEGLNAIKEAVTLQLFGTTHTINEDGTSNRLNSHILLIGDPGTAKTHLLVSASNLAAKGIYVSAEASTGRGLTVAIVPIKTELGETMKIHAGSIVLANGGGLYLDEIDKTNPENLQKLNQAMQDGKISLARAGFNGEYPADAYVLAAANPKFGRFINTKSTSEQINISSTLLDRFDLIFPIRDERNKENDMKIAKKISESAKKKEDTQDKENRNFIRKYIAYARTIKPKMSDEMDKIINNYYVLKRGGQSEGMPIAVRQLQGIRRLAYSSARARLSTSVEKEDVDRAIRLMEYSLNLVARDNKTGTIDIDRIGMGDREEREKKRKLQEILDSFKGRDFTTQQFLSEAIVKGLSEKEAREFIIKAKRDGRIFEPKEGILNILE